MTGSDRPASSQAAAVFQRRPGLLAWLVLTPLLAWLMTTLDREHTVDSLAARALMSPRTFARRFKAETGATPHDWLTEQRVLLARRLLEDTDLGVDTIATRTAPTRTAASFHVESGHPGIIPG